MALDPSVYDVIVIGGGVIGATSAWRISQSGRRVLLLDRGQLGKEASSAAAGMLGAQLEVSEPGPFFQLCMESRALYQAFVAELLEVSGIDAQLTHNGILQIAFTETEVQLLQKKMHWQQAQGARCIWWDSTSVPSQEPVLANSLGGLFLPEDSNVYAPLLTRALRVAAMKTCTVMEGVPVTGITAHPTGTFTVRTPIASYASDSVVIAAGAFAMPFLQSLQLPVSIHPVKGQMLAIRPRHGQRLTRTIFNDHVYLVPKRDGSIVVGATEDAHAAFNREVTIDGLSYLLKHLERMAPGLRDAEFIHTWTGLRPGSAQGEPRIGEVPTYPGLHIALGHFRNGILLAPVTANMIVQSLNHQQFPAHWQAFMLPMAAKGEATNPYEPHIAT